MDVGVGFRENCRYNRGKKVRNAKIIDSNVRYFNEVDDKICMSYQAAYRIGRIFMRKRHVINVSCEPLGGIAILQK